MNKPGEEPLLSLPERHSRILSLLQQNGSISVTQLSELFKVSEVTIRKDLSYLEQQKKLYRTHGSAILISPYISDRHVNEKEKKNVAEKRAIGAAAAALVSQDDSIIIASGTTMAFLAREIKPVGRLTVITAAVPVTQILSQHADVDVIQLGGITRSSSVSVDQRSAAPSSTRRRISSAPGLPPGSRVTSTLKPRPLSKLATKSMCVDLPAPSMPSNVRNLP